MALTEKGIAKLGVGKHRDRQGSGLMLLVREGGKRYWLCRVTDATSKRREIGLGAYPQVSVAEARIKAADTRKTIAAGGDPAQRGKKSAPPAPGRKMSDALEGYVKAQAPAWRSPKTERILRSGLRDHAAALMAMEVVAVGVPEVLDVLQPIWATKPAIANRLRQHVERIHEWARAAGWPVQDARNPAAWRGVLRPLLAKPSAVARKRYQPALPWQRVPDFVSALVAREGDTAALALRFAIFTASRSGEVRGMTWGEVNEVAVGGALWSIPASRMKAEKAHQVPLSDAALAIVREVREAYLATHDGAEPEASALVFRARSGKPFTDTALSSLVRRMHEADIRRGEDGWRDEHGAIITPHGFRSSFRDWAGETGQSREVAEGCLAHALGDATERAYARSTLIAQRRKLLAAWAGAVVQGERREQANAA